jgi:hypothetical protein
MLGHSCDASWLAKCCADSSNRGGDAEAVLSCIIDVSFPSVIALVFVVP